MSSFDANFRRWQQRFPCPKCKGKSLDFIINEDIDKPIICTYCTSYFEFKEIKAQQTFTNVERNQS